jgi:hypothetical protein
MRISKAFFLFLLLLVLTFAACQSSTTPPPVSGTVGSPIQPASFTSVPAAQGEIIEYGAVAGANSLAAAMGGILKQVDQGCGEKPSVGQVFSVKGSTSVAVFFTVVNHAQANRQLAGLVIAVQAGNNDFEAGLIADSANRLAQTANPMMQQLFSAWNPGASSAGSSGQGGAPASNVPLHPVSAPDNSATISVPNGWTVDPVSYMGMMVLHGANGETLALFMSKPAVDPTNPFQRKMAAEHYNMIVPGSVVYAFRGDPAKEYVPMFQAWRKSGGLGPAQIQVQNTQSLPTIPGNHCAGASGQMDPDGKGMQAFTSEICAIDPNPQYGNYAMTLTNILIPLSIGDTEKGLINAIIRSCQSNPQVINQEISELLKKKQQADQETLAWSQMVVNNIHQIGAQATARMNATEESEAQSDAGFDNYLLDQSVVSNGAGHTTMWNTEANVLVQSNPGKYQIVDTPNYWQGVDY